MLNPRQKRFVSEYTIDCNATQAAIRAGYSRKTAKQIASRLLTNVDVADAVAKAVEKRAAKAEIDAAWLLDQTVDLYNECRRAKDRGNARSTAELIAKLAGVLGNKVQHDHSGKVEIVTNAGAPPGSDTKS